MRRSLCLVMSLLLAFGGLAPMLQAEESTGVGDPDLQSAISVPVLKIPGRLTVDFIDDPKSVGTYLSEAFRDPQTYVKMASVLALSALTVQIAHMMPGPFLLRTAVGLSGAFLGWEIGKMDLGAINWTSQLAEIAAATGAYTLVQTMMGVTGVLAGGWAAGAAAVGAAIGAHFLVHKFLVEHEDEGEHGEAHAGLTLPSLSVGGTEATAEAAGRGALPDLAEARARWEADMRTFRDAPSQGTLDTLRSSEQTLRAVQEVWRENTVQAASPNATAR